MAIKWNPLVNTKFSLDGDYSLQTGYIRTLQFESGKRREFLNNSFVPRVFPSISLTLNNKVPTISGKTEYEEFVDWFNNGLRYGTLSFQVKKLGWKRKFDTFSDEFGIYKFISDSLKYPKLDGLITVSFGLEETGVIPEVKFKILATNTGQILLTNNNKTILVIGSV